jgi:HD-GYP domain-containing protein (c-di-GMP phosphodiesterase class II)
VVESGRGGGRSGPLAIVRVSPDAIMSFSHSLDGAYVPVAVATLVPATVTPFSLYQPHGRGYRLYRDAQLPFETADRARLLEQGVNRLYVSNRHVTQYREYLRAQLDGVLADESLPVAERMWGLNEVVRGILQEDFARAQPDRLVKSAETLADRTVEMICRADAVASDVLSVMCHDYHTFTHSANVTYLSVLLAEGLGFAADDLRRVATGALLHDLGKLQIPERILIKPGRLSDAEFGVIQRHPGEGFRQLCRRTDLTWGQLMMVYQHHEDWNGGGYPVGSVGEEIHPWARLCMIADVFEALTSNRPYRTGLSHAEALSLMSERMAGKFDPEMFPCFQQVISESWTACCSR